MTYEKINKSASNNDIGLYTSRSWKATIDTAEPEAFFWVVATASTQGVLLICVDTGIENEITPVNVFPGQPFMIKGIGIKSSGKDRKGNAFTTTAGSSVFVYGGYQ